MIFQTADYQCLYFCFFIVLFKYSIITGTNIGIKFISKKTSVLGY